MLKLPFVWIFIHVLKIEESLKNYKIKYNNYFACFKHQKQKCDDFENISIDKYLHGILHNFHYQLNNYLYNMYK